MAYIDSTYIGAFIPSDVLTKLFTDNGVADDGSKVAQVIATADSIVDAALVASLEVSVPLSGTIPELVKQASFGQFCLLAYGRKTMQVPEQFAVQIGLAEHIRKGTITVPDLAPDEETAHGGIVASESDETAEGGKPLNLSIDKLSVW